MTPPRPRAAPNVGDGPSVSVALCTHQSERFLDDQLASILHQTVDAREVVVSDDASTDATVEIVARHARESRIPVRLVSTLEAGGVVPNFERAVRACLGDVVALADHDDVWTPERLARGVAPLLGESRPALSFSDAILIDAEGNATGARLFASLLLRARERSAIVDGRAIDVLVRRNVVTGATVIANRALLEAALPFPDSWVHDEWLAAIAASIGALHLIDEPLIGYRLHGGNAIGVDEPTVRARFRRMLRPRGGRHRDLASKYADLHRRLRQIGANESVLRLVEKKTRFETARSGYPDVRFARIAPIARQAIAGRYRRLSSQGNWDIVRDLLQPS